MKHYWLRLVLPAMFVFVTCEVVVAQTDEGRRRITRAAMPVYQRLIVTKEWTGIVQDTKLRKIAKQADHVITKSMSWAHLWTQWQGNWDLPEVDFREHVLVVLTASGPNIPSHRLYVTKGNVVGTVGRTLKGGEGFGFRILLVPRSEIHSFFGQRLE